MKCQVAEIQWGGGGSSRKPSRFSGGGVVAEIFSFLRKPSRFSGGGGSSRNFLWSQNGVGIQWGGVVAGG